MSPNPFRRVMVAAVVPLLYTLASGSTPRELTAQPRGSERSTVSQVINGTTITLDFARPVARGRDNLFGGVVHWGEVWTPGANWATTIESDRSIRLNGHEVPPGKYSIWLQPREQAPWTFSLNREWRLYHDSPVPEDGFFLRFDVHPEQGQHMEALNWYFHSLDSRGGVLRMHWGPIFVALEVGTEAFTWAPLPASERTSLLGSFAFDTRDPTTGGPMEVTIHVLEEDGRVVGRWGQFPIALVPAGPAEFMIGFLRQRELFDVAPEMTLRILTSDGVSSGAELRWEGEVFGVGEKVP